MNDFADLSTFGSRSRPASSSSPSLIHFDKHILELKCGCYVVPLHYMPRQMWYIKVEVKARCVRFGCRITTLQVRSKSQNQELGKVAATVQARRPDPLALALYQQ